MALKTHYIQKIRPMELASLLKSLLFKKREILAHGNFKFLLDTYSDFYWNLYDEQLNELIYDPAFTKFIVNYLQTGDTFVDLGANEGWFSIYAAECVGSTGKVYSIEPQNRLTNVIETNAKLNSLENIIVLNTAIGEREEYVNITLSPSLNSGSSSLVKNSRGLFWKKQKTKVQRFDKLFENEKINHIDLIKIDIEGYEFSAIKSMEKMLKAKQIKAILVELHESQLLKLGTSSAEIQSYLAGFGYHSRTLDNTPYFTYL